jgi:cytochrome P450
MQFHYLDAVLNETLRLLPPISLGTIREARTSMQLRGYDIPKGAYINVSSVTGVAGGHRVLLL